MIKKVVLGVLGLSLFSHLFLQSSVSAIVVEIPRSQGNEDVAVVGPEQISGDESSFFTTIQNINKYLWFAIGAVCMGIFVWGGISLISANGDADKMKKTNKLLMGAIIGILICILSYSIVRLVINLFQ